MRPMTNHHRNNSEDKPQKPASRGHRKHGKEVFKNSSSRQKHSPTHRKSTGYNQITTPRPSMEPARRRKRRSIVEMQLDSERQVRVHKKQGTIEEAQQQQGIKPLSSKPKIEPAKQQQLTALRATSTGIYKQGEFTPGSFEDCLNYDSSLSSSPTQPPRKRKRTGPCEAHTQCPAAAMVPQSKAQSCKDLNLLLAASPFPEVTSTLQDCFPQEGPEHPSFTDEQEVAPWAWRSSSKTPVYSPRRPGRPLQQNSYQGRLAKPQSWWETHGQPAPPREDAQLWSQQEGDSGTQTHTDKQTHRRTQTETQAHLRQQESLDLKLQSLRARILNSQAKRPQGRQTKMISFQAQAPSPGQHADSGPGGEASPENVHSLREASGPGLLRRAPRPPLGGSHKTLAKKPAPLMAKALKDYKNRWARK
ncbi:putative elongin-A3 member C [Mesocricetus auratus]|uniref:Elongin-A3 member C n=1 Tax=Mesocricetus auratus TaxID=10036 RepID=A0A1U7QMB9_MESAU|nr:putative elongin-A3 member C [Mesocricetus auratus]